MTNVLFFPSPPLIFPHTHPCSYFNSLRLSGSRGHPLPFVALSTLGTSSGFCVEPLSRLLTASFVVLQLWSVSRWGAPPNAAWLLIIMNIFFYEYWNSRALVRNQKWHHSPGIKVSRSKYFMCKEFLCCQLFPKMI